MPLLKWQWWRGKPFKSARGPPQPRALETGLNGMLDWPDRYVRKFINKFGETNIRANFEKKGGKS